VIEAGQDLALGPEPPPAAFVFEPDLEQLDRHLFAILVVVAHRTVDDAHAPFAELVQQLVRP
jgi:hypothetical protein